MKTYTNQTIENPKAYAMGFNHALIRAKEAVKEHGFHEAFDLANDGEVKVNEFSADLYENLFMERPVNEIEAWFSYDQGIADGMQWFFENGNDRFVFDFVVFS